MVLPVRRHRQRSFLEQSKRQWTEDDSLTVDDRHSLFPHLYRTLRVLLLHRDMSLSCDEVSFKATYQSEVCFRVWLKILQMYTLGRYVHMYRHTHGFFHMYVPTGYRYYIHMIPVCRNRSSNVGLQHSSFQGRSLRAHLAHLAHVFWEKLSLIS
jgi:hypothetical protein